MTVRSGVAFFAGLIALMSLESPTMLRAQLMPYRSGQNIQPVFEGWQKNPDGSYSMWFGYMNRNFVEEPNVPLGAANNIEPGGPDKGQPTHFYPRRMQFAFAVQLPANFGKTTDVVWSLVMNGKTEKAFGTLLPQWEVDNEMIVKNLNTQDDLVRVNDDKPPTLTIDPVSRASAVSPLTLTAVVTDPDGMPKPNLAPPRSAAGRGAGPTLRNAPTYPPGPAPLRQGLSLGWIQYRGPGAVTFSPSGFVRIESGKKATRTATFSEPGTYVLRAIASDSWLFKMTDVTVVVGSGGSQH